MSLGYYIGITLTIIIAEIMITLKLDDILEELKEQNKKPRRNKNESR